MRKTVIGLSAALSIILSSTGYAMANTTTSTNSSISPQYVGTQPGWVFDSVTQTENGYFVEEGHTTVFDNTLSTSSSYQYTVDYTRTVDASATATLSGGWGPVNASVGMTVDTSLATNWNTTWSISVPAHSYGWYDWGYGQDQWYGDYAYQNSNGSLTNETWLYVTSPRTAEVVAKASTSFPSNP